MSRGCSDSEYWDRLLRQCMPCAETCEYNHDRCAGFCAAQRCRANAGHFYDPLLKQCMPCARLCGSHPAECTLACLAQPSVRPPTRLPEDRAALSSSTTRGSALTRAGHHHTVIIYSLLGLCLAALFCTLALALLVLLCRSRARGGHREGPQEQNSDDSLPSSKDRLMDAMIGGQSHEPANLTKAWPTETCVHCFPELRAQRRGEDRPAPPAPPPKFYQQAMGMAPPPGTPTQLQPQPPRHQDGVAATTNHGGSLPGAKDGGLRIICSPTQSVPYWHTPATATATATPPSTPN